MPKAVPVDLEDHLTPEQALEGSSFPDLAMLALPREVFVRLTEEARKRGQTFAEGIGEAISDWLKKEI